MCISKVRIVKHSRALLTGTAPVAAVPGNATVAGTTTPRRGMTVPAGHDSKVTPLPNQGGYGTWRAARTHPATLQGMGSE